MSESYKRDELIARLNQYRPLHDCDCWPYAKAGATMLAGDKTEIDRLRELIGRAAQVIHTAREASTFSEAWSKLDRCRDSLIAVLAEKS